MFSSDDPTPAEVTSAEDIFESIGFSSDPYVLHVSLIAFIGNPTLKHAKKVLNDYKIHQPLRNKPVKKRTRQQAAHPPHLPPRSTRPRVATAGGAIQPDVQELFYLDTFHDLLGSQDPVKVYDAFKPEYILQGNLKSLFLSSNFSFTKKAAEHVYKKTGTVLARKGLFDRELYAQLEKTQKSNTLTFVLDNVVAGLTSTVPMQDGTIGFLTCAFMVVLCANMLRHGLIKNDTIELLDGYFLRMDGNYLSRFIVLFLKTLKRVTSVVRVSITHVPVVAYQGTRSNTFVPVYFNAALGLNARIRQVNKNPVVSLNGKDYNITPSAVPTPGVVTYPHSKQWFTELIMQSKVVDKDLFYLNFLRDAFKADIALLLDSIYITHDTLAHLYYRLVGGKKGILLSIEEKTKTSYEYHLCC